MLAEYIIYIVPSGLPGMSFPFPPAISIFRELKTYPLVFILFFKDSIQKDWGTIYISSEAI